MILNFDKNVSEMKENLNGKIGFQFLMNVGHVLDICGQEFMIQGIVKSTLQSLFLLSKLVQCTNYLIREKRIVS